jgi:hypothetical protein
MISVPKQSSRGSPRHGFVVAMQAKLTTAKGPPWFEWIIVSRWGVAGERLSVSRTKVRAVPGKPAPIHLMPRQTALAGLLRLPPVSGAGWATFLFFRRQPGAVSVAGDFVPAEGYVRLYGRGAALRLHAEGCCSAGAARSTWRVEAVRGSWIGDFIEGPPGRKCDSTTEARKRT